MTYTAKPLGKTDMGDFSQNDPFVEMFRRAMQYYLPGNAPASMHGPNVSTMMKGADAPQTTPRTRINLAELMAARAAQQPQQAQPPLPQGMAMESVPAREIQPGEGMGMPLPDASPMRPPMPTRPTPDMPEMNPNFHDAAMNQPGAAAMSPASPAIMNMAKMMAGAKQRLPFPPSSQWAMFNPGDLRSAPWTT